jgi:hypothetical protein
MISVPYTLHSTPCSRHPTPTLHTLHPKLDVDYSGGLNFDEFRSGVRDLSDKIHLTQDDFDIVTEQGKHLNQHEEFNSENFLDMMRGELWRSESSFFCCRFARCASVLTASRPKVVGMVRMVLFLLTKTKAWRSSADWQ